LVLLFNSRLKLFLRKLKSRWSDHFKIKNVFPHAIELKNRETDQIFKVNEQRLKPYFRGESIPSPKYESLYLPTIVFFWSYENL
jgi:hypothetical protein